MAGCGGEPSASDAPQLVAFGETFEAPSASDAPGATCVDVGRAHRVCYRGDEVTEALRPVPPRVLPVDARWRCFGQGAERRCRVTRTRRFSCEGSRCVQRFPRLPNDGATECSEVSGVVICRTRSASAGMVPGPDAVGWLCNEIESPGDDGETSAMRICVDLAPDVPVDRDTTDCRFEHQPTIHRVCGDGRARGSLGAEAPCAVGLTSIGGGDGVCVPARLPRAECWTARDCAEGEACVLSSCVPEES